MNVFELVGRLTLDKSGYDEGLDEAEEESKGFGSKLAQGLGVVGKVAGGALALAGTATVGLTKKAVDAYGSYEQLAGGIETLFGDSAQTVMENANKAFATAGMSVNQYMETAIQSSASMINALDGDTARASQLVDMSISDMADNVNKMGTSMEAVQNAYRGFSRGNFTMLDNLALGFSGTKEGMQELLDKAQEFSGIEYNVDSYADIVEAIHVVQSEMGITGTTATEASGTITGSLSAVKASWDNLITSLANPDADLDSMIDNLIGNATVALENLFPTITRAVDGIAKALPKVVTVIAQQLPTMIQQTLPSILQATITLAQSLVEVLPTILQTLLDTIIDNLPMIIEGLVTLVVMIVNALPDILVSLVDAIPTIITSLIDALVVALPVLIEGLITFIVKIVESLPVIIQSLIDALPTVITAIINALITLLPQLIQGAITLVIEIVKHLPEIILALIEAIPQIIMAIIEAFAPFVEQLGTVASDAINKMVEWFKELPEKLAFWAGQTVAKIVSFFIELPTKVKEWFNKTKDNATEFFANLIEQAKEKGKQFVDDLINAIQGLPDKVANIGRNIVDGLKNGIKEKWDALVSWFEGLGQNLIDGWNSVFQINSPSKVFEESGGFMAEGLEVGWNKQFAEFEKDLNNVDLNMMVKSNVDSETTPMTSTEEETNDLLRAILDALRALGVDPNSIFRLVKQENEEFKETTGASAFA